MEDEGFKLGKTSARRGMNLSTYDEILSTRKPMGDSQCDPNAQALIQRLKISHDSIGVEYYHMADGAQCNPH